MKVNPDEREKILDFKYFSLIGRW